ncbi:uncharacterized protein LOC111001178 [Pieris rapae]|uniref:uncharacterized protein LOC111001178 n=1 Tax=Pieris rapae TaxID=64459 RepID=UPI001E280633|nr:uncharacterized protein LOC111001178 [Pieris rapae]
MFSIFILICFFSFTINTSALQLNDVILCRTCGNTIAHSNAIIEKKSSLSLKTFNDTLFSSENVTVQILTKDVIFRFPIIITNHSNCISLGEWEEDEELWFSGYRWRPCLCPDCGVLVGWLFEKYNPLGSNNSVYEARGQFYALILPNLVSQKFLNSIIIGLLHD